MSDPLKIVTLLGSLRQGSYNAAVARARAYISAGADMIFAEAVTELAQAVGMQVPQEQVSPEERQQMEALKRAFDPAGLLNPGKVLPTLHRCAEYGRVHVKRGLLAFPELERF